VTEYLVQPGDNLWSIVEEFNISLETLLWANNLNKNSLLQIGQKLVILPTSGVTHPVQKGDTVSQIAKTYKAKIDDILAFNDLSGEGDIYIGDILIVPNGVMPPPVVYAPQTVPLASSYFICPDARCESYHFSYSVFGVSDHFRVYGSFCSLWALLRVAYDPKYFIPRAESGGAQ